MSTGRAALSPAPVRRAPVLAGDRVGVTLAGTSSEDPHRLLTFHAANRGFLKPWLPTTPADFLTLGFWRRWCADSLRAFNADREVRLIVRPLRAPQEPMLGQINFAAIVRGASQSCSVGYHLAESAQGRGLMPEALELAIAYMFQERRLHRIVASHLPENDRSARMLARLGFERVGLARSALYIDGAWRDHIVTAKVNPTPDDPAPGAPL